MSPETTDLHNCLEDSLRPLWMLTRYTGILPDWCNRNENRGRKEKVVSYFSISLCWILLVAAPIYDIVELVIEMKSNQMTLTDLFQHLMVILVHLVHVLVQSQYLLKQSQYLSFFRDWQMLKVRVLEPDNTNKLKKVMVSSLAVWMTHSLLTFLILLCLPLYYALPDMPFTFHLFKEFIGTNAAFLYYLLTLYEYVVMLILTLILDVVPIIIYTYLSFVVSCLETELVEIFKRMLPSKPSLFNSNFVTKIRRCWVSYDTVRQLGDRANCLFGFGLLANQLILLAFICSTLFRCLHNVREGFHESTHLILGIELYRFYVYSFRLINTNLKLSKLQASTKKLHNRMISLLSQYWEVVTEEERAVIIAFINQLHHNPLAAAPLGLYNISYSIFLILSSLIFSNVIILLQSPVIVD